MAHTDLERERVREFAKIGNNLSQIARWANTHKGTAKLSRICPFRGRILLDQRLIINDLAVAAGGENAAKLLNLTVPVIGCPKFRIVSTERLLLCLPEVRFKLLSSAGA